MSVCNCDNPDGRHRLGCPAGKIPPSWEETKIKKLERINAELLAACELAKKSSLCVEARNAIIAAIQNAEQTDE